MRPWLVYSTEYQGRRKRREDSAVIPSYPLWPAFQKASLSHSRVGWAFQEVPKKKKLEKTFLVDSMAKDNIEKKQKDSESQNSKGRCLACFYPRHLSGAATVTLSSAPSARLQPPVLCSQSSSALTLSWTVSSSMSSFLSAPAPHTRLHCARVPPDRCGDAE